MEAGSLREQLGELQSIMQRDNEYTNIHINIDDICYFDTDILINRVQRRERDILPHGAHKPISQCLTNNVVQRPIAIGVNVICQMNNKRIRRAIDDHRSTGKSCMTDCLHISFIRMFR